MTIAWMLISLVAGQAFESGLVFKDASACFEQAAKLQVAAQKAADNATILAHEQNYRAEPEQVLFSCVVTDAG